MRLIDADAFDHDLCNHRFTAALNEAADAGTAFEDKEMYYSTQSFRDVMKYRPTIDAVPVTHGKWRKPMKNYYVQCNLCDRAYEIDDPQPTASWNYCPACGAKMDLEDTP